MKVAVCIIFFFALAVEMAVAFLPFARYTPHMKVGKNTNPGRSRSIGILNSMRENMASNTNPTQVSKSKGGRLIVEHGEPDDNSSMYHVYMFNAMSLTLYLSSLMSVYR